MALPVIAPSRRGLNLASSSRRATILYYFKKVVTLVSQKDYVYCPFTIS